MTESISFVPGSLMTGSTDLRMTDDVGYFFMIVLKSAMPGPRKSIIRAYEKPGDEQLGAAPFELLMGDFDDLVLRVGKVELSIPSGTVAGYLDSWVMVAATASISGRILKLELEINQTVCVETASAYCGPDIFSYQMLGGEGARFDLGFKAVFRSPKKEHRDLVLAVIRERARMSEPQSYPQPHFPMRPVNTEVTYGGHRSVLEGKPRRALIDSNVFLDAALISDGFGARTLSFLNESQISLYIDDVGYRDALRILYNNRARCVFPDLEYLLKECCRRHRITSTPPAAPADQINSGVAERVDPARIRVNRQDRHILNAAKELGAFVVTDDVPLIYQLNMNSTPAVMTRELVHFGYGGLLPRSPYMIGGLHLGPSTSFVFVRGTPGAHVFNPARKESILCAIQQTGHLYYDRERGGFVFQPAWIRDLLLVPVEIAAGQQFVLALNFDFRGSKTRLSLHVAFAAPVERDLQDVSVTRAVEMKGRAPPRFGTGGVQVWPTLGGENGWIGAIECMTWGPGKLSSDSWRTYRTVAHTAPNPLTSDTLVTAMTLLTSRSGIVGYPLLDEVIAKVGNAIIPHRPIL